MTAGIKKIGFLMDAVQHIHPEKDSSIVLMEEAWRRGHEVYYFTQQDLYVNNSVLFLSLKKINTWFNIQQQMNQVSADFLDIIFMRKDPPVDMGYIYTTLLLEWAEKQGVRVINKPQALRDVNEKLATAWFPQCCVPSLVSASKIELENFLDHHKDIILKPLNGMGGSSIFRVAENNYNYNLNVILETLTQNYTQLVIAQKYIPDIKQGDKRVIIMHGEPLPYAISRLAKKGETRANLAAGGSYIKAELTARDKWICAQVSGMLKNKGILLAGLDIIGEYLTEINVTSPTCLREIDQAFGVNTAGYFFDGLE